MPLLLGCSPQKFTLIFLMPGREVRLLELCHIIHSYTTISAASVKKLIERLHIANGIIRLPVQYKDRLSGYKIAHCNCKTLEKPSYLYNGNSYTAQTQTLYWTVPKRYYKLQSACVDYHLITIHRWRYIPRETMDTTYSKLFKPCK